jgi:membrane protease YdiL (CAAX protease family)
MAGRPAARRVILPAGLIVVLRLVGVTLAYLAVLQTGEIVVYGLGSTLVPGAARGAFALIGLGLEEAAGLAIVLVLWRIVDGRPIRELGLDRPRAGRRWFRGAGIAALMMGFVVLVGYTLVDGATWDINSDAARAAVVVVGGFIGFLIQGPSEEVLFRGYILENVRGQWGVTWAVVVSSLSFGLFHASNPAFGLLPFVNLVLFGAATALYKLYIDDGQLWGVFAIHTVWNWLQQVVFGLPNSGNVLPADDSLFSITPNASLPGLFWGGGFGPEGTFAATLALLALLVAGVRRARASTRTAALPPPAPSGRRRDAAGRSARNASGG